MTSIADLLTNMLLNLLWEGAVIGLVTIAVLAIGRPRRATTRYAIFSSAFAMLALAPVVTASLVLSSNGPAAMTRDVHAAMSFAVDRAIVSSRVHWLNVGASQWVVPLWIVGVAFFGLRLIVGCRQVATLRRVASGGIGTDGICEIARRLEQRMETETRVEVALTTATSSPSVIGWSKPVVLIPAGLVGVLSADQLEAMLAHEIAHVRRNDYAINILQSVVEALAFYHPMTWWLSARIREERELCCDDLAVDVCRSPVGYARALVETERLRLAGPVLALGATDGPLARRIQRLLGVEPRARHVPQVASAFVWCVVVGCVGSAVDAPASAGREPLTVMRHDDVTSGTPNPAENGQVAFGAMLAASRNEPATGGATLDGRRLLSIQLSGVSPAVRAQMELPVSIGDTVTSETRRSVDARLQQVDPTLTAQFVPLSAGHVALLISNAGGEKARPSGGGR